MRTYWLWILGGLAACNGPLQLAPEVALKHQHEQAIARQVQLLQAKQVKLLAPAAGPAGTPATLLSLEVLNPQVPASQPDTLKQRVRKLAHLLVADLAAPDRYQAVSVQVTSRQGYFDANPSSQTFIYPLASLR